MLEKQDRKLKALLLDKSAVIMRQYERIMRNIADFEVEMLDSVRMALQSLAQDKPDIIVSDWKLSDHTAIELLKALKSRDEWKNIPVIICIPPQFQHYADQLKNLGADAVLQNPPVEDLVKSQLLELLPQIAAAADEQADEEKKSIRHKISRIQQTATLPTLVQRILQVSKDPRSSASNLGQVIKQDQSLTAKILKIVNSAYYGLYRKVGNVDHAIVILGFDEIRNISLAACLIHFHRGPGSSRFNRNKFWSHSLCTAYVARALSSLRPELNTEDAFVVGLLHDYGKVILHQYFNKIFEEILNAAAEREMPLYKISTEMLDIDHAEIGGIIAENWKLPIHLVKAIQFHHMPQSAYRHEYNIHLAHLANAMCHKYGFGDSGNPVPDEPYQGSLEVFGFGEDEHEKLWKSLNVDLSTVEDILELSLAVD